MTMEPSETNTTAFEYQFGALDNIDGCLGKPSITYDRTPSGLLPIAKSSLKTFIAYIPSPFCELLGDYVRSKNLAHTRSTAKLANQVAKELIDQKSAVYLSRQMFWRTRKSN